ncbi:MAG: IS701 family transposase, partial [Planctomycetes bacterium]|nr:IS701 family transposase [Planctomycetota bacterium]
WKEGTSTAAISRFGWTRVWHALERPAEEGQFEELGLLVEEEAEGTRKYACGRLSPETKNAQAMRLWNSLHLAHQDGREMKEILGLDQFQGRSWRGFHHHACLVMVGYGFLICGGWEKKEG